MYSLSLSMYVQCGSITYTPVGGCLDFFAENSSSFAFSRDGFYQIVNCICCPASRRPATSTRKGRCLGFPRFRGRTQAEPATLLASSVMSKTPTTYGYTAQGTPIFEPIVTSPLFASATLTPFYKTVCTAAASVHPYVCPPVYSVRMSATCNPNDIVPGDEVPIQICVQNEADIPPGQATPESPSFEDYVSLNRAPAEAILVAGTNIEVFLAATTSYGDKSHPGVLEYEGFDPVPGTSAIFEMGAGDRCSDSTACGIMTLTSPLTLPSEDGIKKCLGTIRTRAVGVPEILPPGQTGMSSFLPLIPSNHLLRTIYVGAVTRGTSMLITDHRCLKGITAAAQGFTIAVFADPPSPSPPPATPPPVPPSSPPVSIEKDPHLHFAHGGTADFRGFHGQLYNFFSAPSLAVNLKTEHATFPLNEGRLIVNGSFITEFHLVARVGTCRAGSRYCIGGTKRKWANFSLWASELNEDTAQALHTQATIRRRAAPYLA